jgi:hypothetical protein
MGYLLKQDEQLIDIASAFNFERKGLKTILEYAMSAKQTSLKTIKNGGNAKFKSRKGNIHSFSHPRLGKNLNPSVKSLGKIYRTEDVPKEASDGE